MSYTVAGLINAADVCEEVKREDERPLADPEQLRAHAAALERNRYVYATLHELFPGMDEGAPIEALARKVKERAERAEAERDAAVFAINNHNKDCKASCEEQRSRNSCGFASYYPKKNCPNCPEDWAIDAIGRKP